MWNGSFCFAILLLYSLFSGSNGFHTSGFSRLCRTPKQLDRLCRTPKQLQVRKPSAVPSVRRQLVEEDATIEVSQSTYISDLKRSATIFGAASGFAALLAIFKGIPYAVDFCSGYLLEQSLSIDNLFVILLIFEYFGIERKNQDRALQYGIIGAFVMRAIFIALGSAMLSSFHQVVLVFVGILLYSSYSILFTNKDSTKEDISQNALIKFATTYLKTSKHLDGQKFFTVVDGVRMATPYLLCTICIELSDILFAVDSVPAIFGITKDPFIVYTSNMFAIIGLRSLFGVLSQAMHDLEYLEKAVGVILGIIALKMGLEGVGVHLLSPLQSLVLVTSVLGTGVALSLGKQMLPQNASGNVDVS